MPLPNLKIFLYVFITILCIRDLSAANIDSLYAVHRAMRDGEAKIDLEIHLADALRLKEDYGRAEAHLEHAINEAASLGYTSGQAEALLTLGKLRLGNFSPLDQVTISLLKSLSLYEEINDSSGITNCLLQLAVVNFSVENYENATIYLNRSIQTCPPGNKVKFTSSYLLGLCYSETGRYAEAGELLQEALQNYARGYWDREMLVKGFIGKLLYNQSRYQESIDHLEETLREYEDDVDSTELVPLFAFMSSANLALGEFDKTIAQGEYVVRNSGPGSMIIYYMEATRNLHKAYAAKGRMTDAYHTLMQWNQLSDSIGNTRILDRIANKKAQYEYDKEMMQELADRELEQALNKQELKEQRLLRNLFVTGFFALLLISGVIYKQRTKIAREQKQSDNLLMNILPADVARDLKLYGKVEAKKFDEVTILFTDFKEFTQLAARLTPEELVSSINSCFRAFDLICEKYGVEKIKTIGDSYMVAAGLQRNNHKAVVQAVLCALEMNRFILEQFQDRENPMMPFEMRLGLHTGSVVAGIVGVKKFQYDLWGDTVNTASRMESYGVPGKVNISKSTYDLIKDDPQFRFEHRGKIEAKGKGEIDMYFVDLVNHA